LLPILPLATCQFTQPKAEAVLTAGDKINVTYETEWTNYTVALWQRDVNKTTASLGSIVFGKSRYGVFTSVVPWEHQTVFGSTCSVAALEMKGVFLLRECMLIPLTRDHQWSFI
jgi:hypothetical protein